MSSKEDPKEGSKEPEKKEQQAAKADPPGDEEQPVIEVVKPSTRPNPNSQLHYILPPIDQLPTVDGLVDKEKIKSSIKETKEFMVQDTRFTRKCMPSYKKLMLS